MTNLKVGLMSFVVALSVAQSASAVRIDWEKDPVEKIAVKKSILMGRRIGKYSKIASCKDPYTQMVVNDGEIEVELHCEAAEGSLVRFSFPELSRGGHSGNEIFWGDELVAVRGGGLFGEFMMVEGFVLKSKIVPVSIDTRPAGVMIFVSISRAVKDESPAPFPGTPTP